MTRVSVVDAKPEDHSALDLLLLDLKMEVVGEAAATGHYSHQPSERLNAYLNACISQRQAFVLSDAAWLNERLEIRRTNAVLGAGAKSDSFFK